jgi:hypothetical protein
VHPSTYYVAVDAKGSEAGGSVPLLLHIAPAAAPASSVFYKPLLIGRMRTAAGRESVINAIPFGPCDHDALDRFTAELDASFLPQPRGPKPAVAVTNAQPAAFAAFRAMLKRSGANLASITALPDGPPPAGIYYASLCAAIREGWREGYGVRASIRMESRSVESAKDAIRAAARFSHFAVDVGRLVAPLASPAERFSDALAAAEQLYEMIRQTRSALRMPKQFDFELSFESASGPISREDLSLCLERLKSAGHAAQFVRPSPGSVISEMAATAREFQCLLSLVESPKRTQRGPAYYQLAGEAGDVSERIVLAAECLAG